MRRAPTARQGGATMVMFALFALVTLGFMALAIDLGRAYNRRLEMQNLADCAALGGAGALNGTAAGIDAALLRAQQRTAQMRYDYRRTPALQEAAVSFAATPDGLPAGWRSVSAARSAPAGLLFMRVDAGLLADAGGVPYGRAETVFIRALVPGLQYVATSAQAVAGRYNQAAGHVLLHL